MSSIYTRLSLLASAAAFALILLCTVAFTAPSFAAGLTILLQGARGGVFLADIYQKMYKNSRTNRNFGKILLKTNQIR